MVDFIILPNVGVCVHVRITHSAFLLAVDIFFIIIIWCTYYVVANNIQLPNTEYHNYLLCLQNKKVVQMIINM